VEHNQAHTALNDVLLDALNNLILYLMMGHMAPPNQDVCLTKYGLSQTMLRLIERGRFDHNILVIFDQAIGDGAMNTFGVEGCSRVIGLFFVPKLIPYEYTGHCLTPYHCN
jgi:hypothetical protein